MTPVRQRLRLHLSTVLVLGLLAGLPVSGGCGHTPSSIKTPEGKAAYTASEVMTQINRLRAAAVQANATLDADGKPGLAEDTTRLIVDFDSAASNTLAAAPAGWYPTVKTLWEELKKKLPEAAKAKLAPYTLSVDTVLGALAP